MFIYRWICHNINDKIKRVVACKDFEIDGYRFYDFASIKNTIIRDTPRSGYGTDLLEVLETIREQKIYNPEELSNFFWNMFIVDAYIGNFDRHNGNWGFLINEDNKDVKIAPIYDCGSCLFAEMDTEKKKEVMTKKQELEHRIYNIPRSSLMLKDKKLKYYDFLSSNLIPECTDALYRMNDIIDDNEPMITDMINEIEITQVEKDFYIFMLNKRKEMILEQAIQNIEQNKKNDIDMFDK